MKKILVFSLMVLAFELTYLVFWVTGRMDSLMWAFSSACTGAGWVGALFLDADWEESGEGR